MDLRYFILKGFIATAEISDEELSITDGDLRVLFREGLGKEQTA